jgi:hypothetical protein
VVAKEIGNNEKQVNASSLKKTKTLEFFGQPLKIILVFFSKIIKK